MPVTVQIDGVGKVQLDDSFKGLSPADQQATVDEIANHHVSTQAGPPPSFMDRITASPVGRLIHNAVLEPLGSLETVLGSGVNLKDPNAPTLTPAVTKTGAALQTDAGNAEQAYQTSLANNRNTPGYAKQRALADQAVARRGSGFGDQISAPFNGTAAGVGGLIATGGNLDAMNASSDAQEAAQAAYAKAHPVLSTAAGVVGGLATGAPTDAVTSMAVRPIPQAAANSALRPGAQEASAAGYVLPPRMMTKEAGPVADALQGWAGKIKTAQAASEQNQEVTNTLAKQAIGLNASDDLTEPAIKAVRAQAGQVRKSISQSVPTISTDPQFAQDVANLSGVRSSVATNFPNIAKNEGIETLVSDLQNAKNFPTDDAFEVVRRLRQQSSANFKAFDDADKLALAGAQRTAANHIEDLIERNLLRNGYTGIQDYRAARQLMAKTYDVEAATNLHTGNVNASKLAAMANRGKPLSGELETIANVHSAFPKAMQPLDRIGGMEPLSTLDLGAAALSAAHGNYGVAGALLGKPIARKAVLSKGMQEALLRGKLPRIANQAPAPLGIPLMTALSLPRLQSQ